MPGSSLSDAGRSAQSAAANLATVFELLHGVFRHLGGNCETNADIASRGGDDLTVDADEFALRVDQGTTGVALIDSGVRLQEVLETAVAESGGTPPGADDTGGHRLADAQGIAHRQAQIADPHLIRVPQRQDGKVDGFDFQ
jgi:hypothetical protein